MSIVANLIEWTQKTFEPLGAWGLFILSFMESSFFPIPPDLLLIVLALGAPEQALFLALVCTLGSTLGGMFGYGIGRGGGMPILEKFVKQSKIEKVHTLFNKYEAWAIGIAGFSPIPYKVFTIAAGVFYIDFKKFVIVSFFSRGARFFLEALLILLYGDVIYTFLIDYFNWLSLVGVILLVSVYIVYKRIKNKKAQMSLE